MEDHSLYKVPGEPDTWSPLRKFTPARIALGHTGGVLPLKETLALKLAHAHARDAIYAKLSDSLTDQLRGFNLPLIRSESMAKNREQYLLDPGLGRMLDQATIDISKNDPVPGGIVIIISDGLSAKAVNNHIIPLLSELIPKLQLAKLNINSLVIVEHGRVAIADDIGDWSKADLSLILLGERPGLTVADSLGAYLTYKPKPGLTDESRNCISNIHPGGLSYSAAADKITYLINEAFRIGQSGVALKDTNVDLLTE
ncbi:MAG: ethanolamine ammonia-lyase subunit EutC [Chitinophagaceae bacterium]|nr:ethanolamine ammonia-lyase subunit EutC [Chitinophagaceae bacterium]